MRPWKGSRDPGPSGAPGAVTEEIVGEITEEFGGEDAGYNVEMVELYAGGRYSVYIFKRYTDIRLVMSPELQMAYFGGDWDNFTFPRYDLDMSFYRIYDENGEPFQTENYFPFDEEGVSEGDLVFVIGNPGPPPGCRRSPSWSIDGM